MNENIEYFEGNENMSKVEFKVHGVHQFEKILKAKAVQINATVANQVAITFNDQPLNVKRFQEYVNMYPTSVLEKRPEALAR